MKVFFKEKDRSLVEFICPVCHTKDAGMSDTSHFTLAINHLFDHLMDERIRRMGHLEDHANGAYKE